MSYAPQVKKEKMEVIIRTSHVKVEGAIYKLPDTRLLDMLNKTAEPFIPVSEANVYDLNTGKLIFESSFLAINKEHIVIMAESYTIPTT